MFQMRKSNTRRVYNEYITINQFRVDFHTRSCFRNAEDVVYTLCFQHPEINIVTGSKGLSEPQPSYRAF